MPIDIRSGGSGLQSRQRRLGGCAVIAATFPTLRSGPSKCEYRRIYTSTTGYARILTVPTAGPPQYSLRPVSGDSVRTAHADPLRPVRVYHRPTLRLVVSVYLRLNFRLVGLFVRLVVSAPPPCCPTASQCIPPNCRSWPVGAHCSTAPAGSWVHIPPDSPTPARLCI